MKKFSFQLKDVLTYREFLRDEAEADLAKSLAVETSIQNQLAQIAEQYVAVKHQTEGEVDFSIITSANQYYVFLETKKEELLRQLAQAKITSEQKREVLREAMKQTQALEKLRDRQLEEWKQAAALEEEIIADEINIGRRFRQ